MPYSKTTNINELPEELQARIVERLQDALLAKKYGALEPGVSTFAEDVSRGMNGRICDIEELVPSEWILEDPANAAILQARPHAPITPEPAFPSPDMLSAGGGKVGYELADGALPFGVGFEKMEKYGDWLATVRVGEPDAGFFGASIHESFEDAYENAYRHVSAEYAARGRELKVAAKDGKPTSLERAKATYGGRFEPPSPRRDAPAQAAWQTPAQPLQPAARPGPALR